MYFCNSTIPTVDVQNKKRNVHLNEHYFITILGSVKFALYR